MGVRIANSKGVPGTLGCIARTTPEGRTVLLTAWHVLFGNGGGGSEVIWRVADGEGAGRYARLGRALYGKLGIVRFGGNDYYVDCALGSCAYYPQPPAAHAVPRASGVLASAADPDTVRPGDRVTKRGAATGMTAGVVVDVAYCASARSGRRTHPRPRQLLIRSLDAGAPFCAEGDSGAVVVNDKHEAVGLLWGTGCGGEGVASPMAPVLRALNISLAAVAA